MDEKFKFEVFQLHYSGEPAIMLAHYDPKTALYFGHRYAVQGLDLGYMAGGGYILSRKALEKFAETLIHNETVCHAGGGAEDWEMGWCLLFLCFISNFPTFLLQDDVWLNLHYLLTVVMNIIRNDSSLSV